MYSHRVEVLHVADGDAVICTVAHHLVLDLFPADAATVRPTPALSGWRAGPARRRWRSRPSPAPRAAGATERVGRPDDEREADLPGKCLGSPTEVTITLSGTGSPISCIKPRNRSRSSARRMVSSGVPSRRTPYRSSTPAAARSTARLRPVCPPSVGSRPSGRSCAMMRSTTGTVSGSIYTVSAMSSSVMIVAGFELTSTEVTPLCAQGLRARHSRTRRPVRSQSGRSRGMSTFCGR